MHNHAFDLLMYCADGFIDDFTIVKISSRRNPEKLRFIQVKFRFIQFKFRFIQAFVKKAELCFGLLGQSMYQSSDLSDEK